MASPRAHCPHRIVENGRNECGPDAYDCDPRNPQEIKHCYRFRETNHPCPVCLSTENRSDIMQDTEDGHYGCRNCGTEWATREDYLKALVPSLADALDNALYELTGVDPGPAFWDAFAASCPDAIIVELPRLLDEKTGEWRAVDIKEEKETQECPALI